jgi:polyketide synthase PksN
MDYAKFAALYEKVRARAVTPEAAAVALNAVISGGPPAHPAVPREVKHFRHGEPYLRDHLVDGQQVLIGVTYASLALDRFFEIHPDEPGVHLQGLEFVRPVVVALGDAAVIRLETRQGGDSTEFQVLRDGAAVGAAEVVATGRMKAASFAGQRCDVAQLATSLMEYHRIEDIYLARGALTFGDSFKTLERLYVGGERVLARVALTPESQADLHAWGLHPLVINSAFLGLKPLITGHYPEDLFLPFAIRSIHARRPTSLERCWLLIDLIKKTEELVLFDFDVIDDAANVVARFEGCALKRRRVHPINKARQSATVVNPPVERAGDALYGGIQRYLAEQVAETAGLVVADIDVQRNIMDMGLDSAQVVEIGAGIKRDFNVDLYPTLFFEYTNIKELTEYFIKEHRDSFSSLAERSAPVVRVKSPVVPGNATRIKAETQASGDHDVPGIAAKLLATSAEREPIAIIGMHGVFAQSEDLEKFWTLLCNETDLMREVPPDHWDYRPWFDEEVGANDKTYCKWGSFIDDVDKFDASFFNLSRREAEWIDPQVRLLLESVYATAENAGCAATLRGTRAGVFVGACFHDYQNKIDELRMPVSPHAGVNNAHTVMANRISYHFDLTGPSVTVDTACSSSLVAMHQACQALHNDECDVAFVCGANLLLSSMHYRVFSSLRALSPTGRCHTFDASADGYVPGECVASLLLKPLGRAIRDGDRIEAVIRGSAALHGGYTPSLTAPSVAGEQNVILKAWDDAGIDPGSISYVEAHGTGTRLGDPIEINALKNAFAARTDKQGFCSIGSIKANIGHAEGAAGIAGVLKVILQMKHRQIPPLMGFKTLNPYITLEKSALRLDPRGAPWDSPTGVPRRAGISSFGVAGAYAHLVLEEYLDQTPPSSAPSGPVAVVLSAKNDVTLRAQASRLLECIEQGGLTDSDLPDAAYTLQCGRPAMDSRLAIRVGSLDALRHALSSYLDGRRVPGMFQGRCKRSGESPSAMSAPDVRPMTSAGIEPGDYDRLLERWVGGSPVDWRAIHANQTRRFLPLPTYPFARERYWLPEAEVAAAAGQTATLRLHPLLHENTSDLRTQSYRTRLDGAEFFVADHRIRGAKVVPGVVHLEMARAAIAHSCGWGAAATTPLSLADVVWMRPIVIGTWAEDVHIEVQPESAEVLRYEIFARDENSGERTLYSYGRAHLKEKGGVEELDLAALRQECNQQTLSAQVCYELIASVGLDLGESLRGIEAIHAGSAGVLVALRLPDSRLSSAEQFMLHPTLLDSSLQACASLPFLEGNGNRKLAVPYRLGAITVLAPCRTSQMWAFVRSARSASTDALQVDIDVCDQQGGVCARVTDLEFRPVGDTASIVVGSTAHAESVSARASASTVLAIREWIDAAVGTPPVEQRYGEHVILFCDLDDVFVDGVVVLREPSRHVRLKSRGVDLADRFESMLAQVFGQIQSILRAASKGPVLLQVVFGAGPHQEFYQAFAALLKTARAENSKVMGQVIDLGSETDVRVASAHIWENASSPDHEVSYRNGNRQILVSREVGAGGSALKTVPWRDDGVYLITGGAGEVGLAVSLEIARRVRRPRLVLAGRSAPDRVRTARLDEIRALGAVVTYRQVDVTDGPATARLVEDIVAEHNGLNGIIHCAGLLRDEPIYRRNAAELTHVTAPKVRGVVYLDEASKDLPLDVFLMFSSIAGVFGNAGQADYAVSNAFMDAYAQRRQKLSQTNLRRGHTLSVAWPLWKEGGMRPNEAVQTWLRDTFGLAPIETAAAFEALYRGLSENVPQLIVLSGRVAQIREKLLLRHARGFAPGRAAATASLSSGEPAAGNADSEERLEKTVTLLVQRAATVLKTRPQDIDARAALDSFGFNSVALTEYVNLINREFTLDLTPTIFYEHDTLSSLGRYLLSKHPEAFVSETSVEPTLRVTVAPPSVVDRPPAIVAAKGEPRRGTRDSQCAVAVVGISGSFPMARDLSEFWRNLVEGRDCISEIPADRWNWQEIYGDPQKSVNKSNIKWGGFIDGIAEFDPLFFGISPREAAAMDPQQRLLMTHAWLAIEDAGYSAHSLAGTDTGVFVGTTATGYGELLNRSRTTVEAYTATGVVPSLGPGRLSYFLDLRGPSEPIETACSSALVAVHRAVHAIRSGECGMVLVGGVNTILSPELHISFNKAGMLSEDGRCKAFSARANGFARGEGVGMMLLKELKAAEQSGDHIYAVIRGTAQNHGGRAKSLTAPNPRAQAELLKRAYADAGIDPTTVSYVETHGTGTALGDPIEIEGLQLAFEPFIRTGGLSRCGIGSVKSNIGHLELAAGIAGIFKVLLQLKHKTLVKSLHCESINPYIRLDDGPFYVLQENRPWQAGHDNDGRVLPRRAGVSSFGFGGTNCHVVIEEYMQQSQSAASVGREGRAIVPLSAKNSDRLRERARQLLDHLQHTPAAELSLDKIAYTLQVGREPMDARLALLAASVAELTEKLFAWCNGREVEALFVGEVKRRGELVESAAAEEALQEVAAKWMTEGKHARVLRLWVQGVAVDWSRLYEHGTPGRIALPGYPFSRDRFWTARLETAGLPTAPLQDGRASDQGADDGPVRCLEKVWRPSEEPQAGVVDDLRTVAILVNPATRGLGEVLRHQFARAEIIDASETRRREGIPAGAWKQFGGCIDLLGCDGENEDSDEGDELSWRLPQQMLEHGSKDRLTFLCVTRGLEAHQNDEINLSGALSAGLYRMMQNEYSYVRSRHLDVERGLDDQLLARQIAREYRLDTRTAEVCYRGGQRLTPALRDNSRWRDAGAVVPFPAEGVLWITGGTRGLGYRVAQHFVANYGVRRLVLTGREDIPPRDQWLAHQSENTPMGRRIRAFQDLDREGVELLTLGVDLASEAAVRSCLRKIKAALGDVAGVIHCAGMISKENAAFVRKSSTEIREVLRPKVVGLKTLFKCVSDEPLKFFVAFSSASAVVPSLAVGLSDYAMANAYLDYFAQSKHRKHPIISIQWPRWNESGMRAPVGRAYESTGLLSHSDEEGLHVLDSILRNRAGAVVMPAQIDPRRWDPAALLSPPTSVTAAEPFGQRRVAPPSAAAALVSDAGDMIAAGEQWLTRFFADELKIPIGSFRTDVPFQEYGMESVMLAQVVGRMERELEGLILAPAAILENPTIGLLAAYLVREHSEATRWFAGKAPALPSARRIDAGSSMPRTDQPEAVERQVLRPPSSSKVGAAARKVAIVGMSAHFPDAPDVGTFWDNLIAKRDSIKEVPLSRWDINLHYSAKKGQLGKSVSKWGAFLDHIEDFDPDFFKISESLAVQMDPLERQWLEVSTEALADAGYDSGQLWGKKVGVFVGARTSNYRDKLTKIDKDVVVGLGQNFIAAHLAHIYNFKGPNLVVDAACASSLTAVHLALESVKRGESEVALAGGVEILLDEAPYIVLSTAQVLSPQGRCRTFDERADGIGLGEGCAVFVLKLLDQAIADGDKIYGVIDGSAINNDGRTMGTTTPNPDAQSELIETAIASGDVDRSTISYVEMHGTGTLIGDPIELNALTRVFAAGADQQQKCGVGSVKSNIGHLLSAAGAAGVMKVLLSIVHRKLPPSIHCDTPNPRFNFARSPLFVVSDVQNWAGVGSVLRAGVSSFGLGGNNAHVIISDDGIPSHLRATLEPRGEKVSFSRRRFWPRPKALQPMSAYPDMPSSAPAADDTDMLIFFDVRGEARGGRTLDFAGRASKA